MSVVVPSSDKDRQTLKSMLVEMTNSFAKIDAEKEHVKNISSEIVEQFELPKRTVNKLAKTMYNRNYESLQQENEDFEILYETLVGLRKPVQTSDEE